MNGDYVKLLEDTLLEAKQTTNAFFWKKGKEWLAVKPQSGNKSTITLSSKSDEPFYGTNEEKSLDAIKEVGNGFYKCYIGDGTFRNYQVTNIAKADVNKEIAKIEKAEGKTKSAFTDTESGGRGTRGQNFQNAVRGGQEAASRTRQEKLVWLEHIKKAKKLSDIVLYKGPNVETAWRAKSLGDMLKGYK
jgi:hypothetical protein